jgi:hypothetical protein
MIWAPRPEWQDHARCAGYPSEMFYGFFAERPERSTVRIAMALEVCAACPVLEECREAGRDEPFGIWGGTTSEDRGFDRAGHRIGAPKGPAVGTQRVTPRHGDPSYYKTCTRRNGRACADCRHAYAEDKRHRDAQAGRTNHHARRDDVAS